MTEIGDPTFVPFTLNCNCPENVLPGGPTVALKVAELPYWPLTAATDVVVASEKFAVTVITPVTRTQVVAPVGGQPRVPTDPVQLANCQPVLGVAVTDTVENTG